MVFDDKWNYVIRILGLRGEVWGLGWGWLISLGVGCFRFYGIFRMCNVLVLFFIVSRCCFFVKYNIILIVYIVYVCLKFLNFLFGFIFFILVMWLILVFGDYVNLICFVREKKWLLIFLVKVYFIFWRKRWGFIFIFGRGRLWVFEFFNWYIWYWKR